MDNHNRITYLFYRYFDDLATPAEKKELAAYLDTHETDIKELMEDAWDSYVSERKIFNVSRSDELFQNILKGNSKGAEIRVKPWLYLSAAALAAACLLIFLFTDHSHKNHRSSSHVINSYAEDLNPGSNKAVLTLADGSKIVLDEAKTGSLAHQGEAVVKKAGDGQLVYEVNSRKLESADEVNSAETYNSIETPNGGMFQLSLPDGTKVWLNAASSLKYPTSFTGKERKVYLVGEGYFEVEKDALRPFLVQVNNTTVTVLGTHFNIKAYKEDAEIKTTLLEGAVKIKTPIDEKKLTPGKQAVVGNDVMKIELSDGDVNQAVAWKNGYFYFRYASLKTVMNELSRWYDVEVKYEGNIPKRQFGGEIPRNIKASGVLKILELNKIHFRIEGKKIIVTP